MLLRTSSGGQTTLYSTEFEAPTFAPSTTGLTGKDGWVVSGGSTLSAAQAAAQPVYGVDSGKVVGLGQTAYIGSETPLNTSSLYSAYRPTPVTSFATNPIVRFTATIGIAKSYDVKTNGIPSGIQYASLGRNDTFRISFYNNGATNNGSSRRVLGSIEWPTATSTSTTSGSIYRGDGSGSIASTGVDIIYDEPLQLVVVINFQTNRWSASLDGSPLFVDTVFRNETPTIAQQLPLTGFGMVAVQWAITPYYSPTDTFKTNPLYDHPGNNWMLFDDWSVFSEPLVPMTFKQVDTVSNQLRLSWSSEVGYSYRVEYSSDLATWSKTLPGSLIIPTVSDSSQTFTVPAVMSGKQFYRVRRALTGTSGL